MKRIAIITVALLLSVITFASVSTASPTLVWSVDTGSNPTSVTADASGNLYVVNATGATLQKFDPTGALLWTTATSARPTKVLVNPLGYALVLSRASKTLQTFNPSTGALMHTFNPTITPTDFGIDGNNYVCIAYKYINSGFNNTAYVNRYRFAVSGSKVTLTKLWSFSDLFGTLSGAALGVTYNGTAFLAGSETFPVMASVRLRGLTARKYLLVTKLVDDMLPNNTAAKAVKITPNNSIFVLYTGHIAKMASNGTVKVWKVATRSSTDDIAFDAATGEVYSVDEATNDLRKYSITGRLIYTFYVTSPKAVMVGADGSVFIVRYDNNKLEKYTP